MSVLSSETRLAGTSIALLPRVNLLPPEIAERAVFRRIQLGLGAGVLAAAGVVGLLFLSATHGVSSAQSDLDGANAQSTTLQAQSAKYRDVTAVYARAAAAQVQLSSAMGDEVRYSQLLNDLSLTVPSNVWIKSLTYTQTPPAAAAGTAAVAPTVAGAAPIGTFSVAGVGFSHDDVAVWLESVAGLKTYQDPYFSTSTEALIGTRKTVNFSSTATVVSKALSGRYTKAGG